MRRATTTPMHTIEEDKEYHVVDLDLNSQQPPAAAAPAAERSQPPQKINLDLLGLHDFVNPESWRAASVEFVATAGLACSSVCIVASCSRLSDPLTPIALLHVVLITLLILSAGGSSGGHLNPCVSFVAMFAGALTPARTLLYTVAQCLGGCAGTLLVKQFLSTRDIVKLSLGGCAIVNDMGEGIPPSAAFASEFFFTFLLMFVAVTTVVDPMRGKITGPIFGPMLIAITVGLAIFMSGGLNPGYTGAGMNPARCLGPAIVMGDQLWENHWVFWVGPYLATFVVAVFYNAVPPNHAEKYRRNRVAL